MPERGNPAARGALLFWGPLVLLCSFFCVGLIRLSRALPPDLRENSNDLALYRTAGEAVLRGDLPYRDFFFEYPPGSLPAFIPPALFSESGAAFTNLFSAEMALVLAAALGLVACAARRLRGPRSWPVPAATFATAALLLYPVAVTRYDAVVALTLALACLGTALGGRYGLLAYASLGFGTAAKLVPALATLPLAFASVSASASARRGAARGYAVFAAVVALFFVPAAFFGGGFVDSFAYHADRGLQIESVPASVLMALGWVDGAAFEFGAFEARGRGVEAAAAGSAPLTAALLLVTGLALWREKRRRGLDGKTFPRYAAALILAFMLGSKVLSPQYVIWLLPLVPLSAGGAAGAGLCLLFLAACFTTTEVFPHHYADLLELRYPGPRLLMLRNALLAALWVALVLPWGKNPGGARA